MSVHAIREAERTRESRELQERPMSFEIRRGEGLVGANFIVAALGLALAGGVDGFSLSTAALFVVAIAAAANVRFDVGAGFTVPIQVIFVPMLFAVPVALAPALVALGLALGMAPKIARGKVSPSWLMTAAGNSWFAVGPALVLALVHVHGPGDSWAILIVALAAQFAVDFIAAAVRDRLFDDMSLAELLAEVRPIYAIDAALAPLGLLVAFAISWAGAVWPLLFVAPLFLMLRVFSYERRERIVQLAELGDAYQGTALLLGDVVEADDSYTGEHSKSVVRLALDVCDALGIDADTRRQVEFGALLHDVGKIAVPKAIINKPGKLDEREWAIMRTHTIEGQRMLEKIGGFMRDIGLIVRASHERWDGSGYPDGLSGEAIPLEARIVAACDAFNAMTTTRSYRTAMSARDAVAEVGRCTGTHFDPFVVEGLLRVVGAPEAIAEIPGAAEPSTASTPALQVSSCPPESVAATVQKMAQLAVDVGANVRRGQLVEVSGEIGHLEMLRAIAEAAYARGANFVDLRIVDPVVQRVHVGAAPARGLAYVPRWELERVRELAASAGASILVTGPSFPGIFDELDPARLIRASQGASAAWRDAARVINWTIVPAATPGWAARLRPELSEDDALSALWADLAHVCRLDEPDPGEAWRVRLEALHRRAAWLSELELRAVLLQGPGTELLIGLIDGVRWERPQMRTPGGIAFLPNLPTEEVYTTPDPARVDGHVSLTRPVVIGGREIEDVALRFAGGRVVEITGPPGVEALREFVARDVGTARLGELALVDAESRVAALATTFGDVLLDENAASHIALGYGFAALVPEGSQAAANTSEHHLDVMVGCPELRVTGIDRRGREHPLLRDGSWAKPLAQELGTGAPAPRALAALTR